MYCGEKYLFNTFNNNSLERLVRKMKNEKSFFKQFFHLATGAGINLIIGVFTTPIITRLVNPIEYGQLSLFNTYSSIAVMIFVLGLDQSIVRFYYSKDDEKYKKSLVQTSISISLLLAVIGIIAIFCIRFFVPSLFGFDNLIVISFCINIIVLILNRFSMLILRLKYKTVSYSSMNVLSKLLYISITIIAALIIRNHYIYILVFATIVSVAVSTIVCLALERETWKRIQSSVKINKTELLKYGIPLMISSGIFIAFQATDKLCIKHFETYSEVGIYSSAQSLMSVFAIVQTTFNTLWAPKSIQHYESNKEDLAYYSRMNAIITVLMFSFGCAIIAFKDIFILMLGESYRSSSSVIPFLMLNPIMYTISETTIVGLNITKRSNYQVIITAISCIANVVGNFLLIPLIGIKGAAVSTGLSYILFFTLRTYFSNKFFRIDFGLKRFYSLLACFLAVSIYSMNYEFNLILLILIIAFFAIMIILYKNTLREIVFLVKRKLKHS